MCARPQAMQTMQKQGRIAPTAVLRVRSRTRVFLYRRRSLRYNIAGTGRAPACAVRIWKKRERFHMLEFRYDTQLLIEGKGLDEDAIAAYFQEHFQGRLPCLPWATKRL